ncbi:AraC family transcriptional regulator [Limnoglobus roseus]|uniref:AraC family transcriptional regulator n=1 Tax=Limnoglobus roseus TaxID=2598579 RepID=A0A5C1AB92_9BACT|nr:DNA-binding transcriptional regulator [Limnoglobus roseus]QEL15082.1 AraC family transcriptional regulator [Limnoglobus roseus]
MAVRGEKRAGDPPSRPHVALLVEMSGIYGRRILEGVRRHQRLRGSWSIFLDQRELRSPPPPWLLHHRWDGIICRSTTPALARAFRRSRTPVVDLNDLYGGLGLPRIRSDMHAIGRLGAAHLAERGYRQFAFCGFSGEVWSAERLDGFRAALGGAVVHEFHSPWRGPHAPVWDRDQGRLAAWLARLPKPVGLMACNDVRGQHVLNACKSASVAVPEQAAVVGVDDDQVLCELCSPQLSSVRPNAERIGYEAAELLEQLMAGVPLAPVDRRIEPLDVVTRLSSDSVGIDDPDVAAAVTLIRAEACSGLTVPRLIARLAVSRSQLERRFRAYLGRSPQAEIRATQIRRARQLLTESDLPLSAVAKMSGFSYPEYMSAVFRRLTGTTPGAYRKAETARGGRLNPEGQR